MTDKKPSLAAAIAPEDLRRGDYVAVLHEVNQLLVCFDAFKGIETVSVRLLPFDDPQPLEVTDICLPFVTVKRPGGAIDTLDVRRHELARLDSGYARRVARRMKARRGGGGGGGGDVCR